MNPLTTQDVRLLMRAYIDSVALNTALEMGLFGRLAEQPQTAAEIAARLAIPPHRAGPWLDLLAGLGLLERQGERYAVAPAARAAILDAFSPECWMHLAEEERYRFPFGVDLARHIGHPVSVWAGQNRMPHDYLRAIAADAGFAARFTQILYELHRPLADAVAGALDMRDVARLMDLGGGSGVVSLALLGEHPALSAVVVDHPHVCAAGQAIAATRPEGARLGFVPGDFTRDPLPEGCDMALMCDVGIYSEALFRRVWVALPADGRFVIIDELDAPRGGDGPMQRRYAFYRVMTDFPTGEPERPSVGRVQGMLARAGFRLSVERNLPEGMVMIQGVK